MTEAVLSLLMLAALVGLVVESYCRRRFPLGIRQGIRDARMTRRTDKTIGRARQAIEDARHD